MNNTTIFTINPNRWSEDLIRFNEMASDINEWLRGYEGEQLEVDEVAIVLPRQSNLTAVLTTLVKVDGVEYFNNATDKVDVMPFGCDYGAEFHFLRTPYPWRLELCRIGHGCSPVHEPYDWFANSKPALVHFSFKSTEASRYDELVEWMMEYTPAVPAQECVAGYGKYGYWRLPLLGNLMAYVKPRVNLRDRAGEGSMTNFRVENVPVHPDKDPVGEFTASGGAATGRARVASLSADVEGTI